MKKKNMKKIDYEVIPSTSTPPDPMTPQTAKKMIISNAVRGVYAPYHKTFLIKK